MSRAFVFPGQGSQEVGMGRGLSEAFTSARLVFEEIDDALGQKLSSIIFKGFLLLVIDVALIFLASSYSLLM